MGFTTFSSAVAAFKPGDGNILLSYAKTSLTSTLVATRFGTFWYVAGMPVAGSIPTPGLAGAVALDKTSSLYFPDAAGGSPWWIGKMEMNRLSGSPGVISGMFLLLDRLAHANVAINQATGSFSPVIDGTARLGATEGGMIIAEVTTALSAAANVFTLTYTNENGVSHTTPQITTVASAAVGTAPQASYVYIPLADGDRGCRTITDWTLISGTATGNINIAIVKPLFTCCHPLTSEVSSVDTVIMKQGLSQVDNNACLMLGIIGGTGSNFGYSGTITLIQG